MVPQNLFYGRTHEWFRLEESGEITLGVTEHGQSLLGDLVFVELPEVGKIVKKGEACAVLESVKAASDVICPVDGEVVSVNDNLNSEPVLINDDAFGEGWIMVIRPGGNPDDWMSPAEYEDFIQE